MNLRKIIIALDSDNFNDALTIVKNLKKDAFAFKIGYEFFLNFGITGYKTIQEENVNIFCKWYQKLINNINNQDFKNLKILNLNFEDFVLNHKNKTLFMITF